jgi:uncharacterized membrane protein YhhN
MPGIPKFAQLHSLLLLFLFGDVLELDPGLAKGETCFLSAAICIYALFIPYECGTLFLPAPDECPQYPAVMKL